MTDVYPSPFIPASVLADLTPEGRRRLFRSLYEKKQRAEAEDAEWRRATTKAAINSTYGQMNYVADQSAHDDGV
jgi:hypothetical protein